MKKKALFVFISVLSTAILLAALSVLFPASVYNIIYSYDRGIQGKRSFNLSSFT